MMTRAMKSFLSALAFLLVFCFGLSSVANAKDPERSYVVVKGDYLEKIARAHGTRWPTLAKLNNLTDPDHIVPGQTLKLPDADTPNVLRTETTHRLSAESETPCVSSVDNAETFAWKNFGAEALRETSLTNALALLCIPEHVSKQFLERVANGTFDETVGVSPGNTFDAMTFGRGHVRRNVVASWKDQVIPARVYIVLDGSTEYRLFYPLPCGNWAKQVRQVLPPSVPASPELVKQPKHQPPLPEIPVIWGGPCNCNERDTSWWKPPSDPYPEIYHGS